MRTAESFIIIVITAVVFGMYGAAQGASSIEKRIVEQCHMDGRFSITRGDRFTCTAATGGAK